MLHHPRRITFFFFNDTATTEIYTLSLHDALPIYDRAARERGRPLGLDAVRDALVVGPRPRHSAAHRYRVDRRVSGAVVGADEHDSPVVPYRHRPGRTAAPAAPAPAPVGAGPAAAARECREREHA